MNKQEYTGLVSRLLTLVRQTKETRELLNIVPSFTPRTQAAITLGVSRKQIEKAAKVLEGDGIIRMGDTRNDKYYELIEQKEIEFPPRA